MPTLTRDQWEEPAYRIADHTSSPPVDPTGLLYTVNHYPGVSYITPSDPVSWFRSVQRSYVDDPRRGYSIGYNWGYWPDGLEVELRGWDYRNAANDAPDRPGNENIVSVSLLFVVAGKGDAGQPATPAQIIAARMRLEDVWSRVGRALPNIVHGDLEATACAGAGINRQTHLGEFQPVPPDPYPPTEGGEDDPMIVIKVGTVNDYAAFAQTSAGVLRWIVDGRELAAWEQSNPFAWIDAVGFAATVDHGRTLGNISPDVTRITGVTADRWASRLIA